jgi:hypothetical protein
MVPFASVALYRDGPDAITSLLFVLVLFAVGGFVYFIPSIVARGKNRFNAILVLNIFLGWTLIGWVGALVWAVAEKPEVPEFPPNPGTTRRNRDPLSLYP